MEVGERKKEGQREQEEKMLRFWLGTIDGIGIERTKKLLAECKGFRGVFEAGEEKLGKIRGLGEKEVSCILKSRRKGDYRKEWERLYTEGIGYYSYFGEEYPERLRHIYRPPKHLYVKGRLPNPARPAIGIVGARDCSCYGRDMARLFGYRLAEAGVQIISGMAKGIDGWAHRGALESGGQTFAVLGCGVEVCYPAVHRWMYERIPEKGGIISEFAPKLPASPRFFPIRNRIISGLSDGILIVEARERSGSLITADAALEQGRDVFVIPGRIGDELSIGCNRLIRQGAVPVESPKDILEYYEVEYTNNIEEKRQQGKTDEENCILKAVRSAPTHIGQILLETNKKETEVMKALLSLEKKGEIREISRGYFIRMNS